MVVWVIQRYSDKEVVDVTADADKARMYGNIVSQGEHTYKVEEFYVEPIR